MADQKGNLGSRVNFYLYLYIVVPNIQLEELEDTRGEGFSQVTQ
jgi:hypothetical protein